MLFSIPTSGWVLIALAATAVFLLGMRALIIGAVSADGIPPEIQERSRRTMRRLYTATPVVALIAVGVRMLRPEEPSTVLFLYSVAFTAIPLVLLPVRGRLSRAYLARLRNPGAAPEPDRVVTVWLIASLMAVCLAATAGVMAAKYGG
ncbi:hypothetical protein [Nocardiopsis potens]|uniref:hypothetical protein n=1 Tax=Nocardiopsis potens TaxID=1246458 RepID=UPI0003461510|nr:hypothetical protein [Nocardiopsis potens]